ncbi:alpha/beta hydrolase-fold protein [Opitutus terrae]|uniref:Tetratricopeptide TPR_2 repeat protein n=1 Tax=Opitutus terrae (strain DSM 11246 / JCM 15787 / PB90-1) TaxID=452637 RepID=B1ZWZ2_OPITP|nr:alpha/beta hydrolase-fold protein [Opitutus terrae]ACB75103.1 Tetratricopeptide TPR_2 repeat protein [Opitutus terrae PB90-1]
MKNSAHVLIRLFLLALVPALAAGSDAPVIGIGHKHTIESPRLGENVDLVVHLPAGYGAGTQRYPVLLFLGSDARAKFTQAAGTLDCMTDAGQLPAFILVGLDLPRGNFVLVPQENPGGTASADRHLAALADEIVPFVDRTFRTNGYRILYGASNSGVFAVYALLSGKLPVQAYFASSPMLGWCPKLIREKTEAACAASDRARQFLFLIASDDDYERATNELPGFAELLRRRSPGWLQWKQATRTNEGHVPEMDVALGLRALFPDYNPPHALLTLAAMREHYATLSERYGFRLEVPESLLFDTGYSCATAGGLEEAQRLFEFGTKRYPASALLHAGLGFVHQKAGRRDAAIAALNKALQLEPTHGWASRMLAELQPPTR